MLLSAMCQKRTFKKAGLPFFIGHSVSLLARKELNLPLGAGDAANVSHSISWRITFEPKKMIAPAKE